MGEDPLQLFDRLTIENEFVESLPGDPIPRNYVREVSRSCFSRVEPRKASHPTLVATSDALLADLDISSEESRSSAFLATMAGNSVHPDMKPYAACYGGHQFGHWAGQLGDGRAITLCELPTTHGHSVSIQLKGAGPTPYARNADGLAVLRSSLREYVCSEAMFHLGIPTTRALALVTTGDEVVRDILYDGHPAPEPGAIVCRVSRSFVRFGNFQMHYARREHDLLKHLADYTITRHFKDCSTTLGPHRYLEWFQEVCRRTAFLIAEWMRVGFVHGVMNTDNMSILGETIDYGPYGWLESYDPNWTPNTTDASTRRYRYANQPAIGYWNLLQLANSLVPLIGETKELESAVNAYTRLFGDDWSACLRQKLGLKERQCGDTRLLQKMEDALTLAEIDMPIFFRRLAELRPEDGRDDADPVKRIEDALYDPQGLTSDSRALLAAWLRDYSKRVMSHQPADVHRVERMNRANPLYVPRNYLAQLAIDRAAAGDFTKLSRWMQVLKNPYTHQSDASEFAGKRPEWARHRPGCSMLSCSS